MKEKLLNKQIPSLIGILVILVGIIFTTILARTGTIFTGNASPPSTPKNITITNVTDKSATVSYLTDDRVVGTLSYGESKNTEKTALDDRDQLSGQVSEYRIHNFTLNNLKPETQYFFSITSKNEKFLNNGDLFSIKTGVSIEDQPNDIKPVVGKLILPSGAAPSEGIVYFGTMGAQNFSSLVKADGSYIIPLNSVRKADLSSFFDFASSSDIKIVAIGDGLESKAVISSDQTSPAPTITLSYNYDFRNQEEPLSSPPSGNFPTFDSVGEAVSATSSASITTPKQGAQFSDQQPLFQGTAVPGESVEITIQSDPINTTVTANNGGQWSFRPSTKLAPGNHTITITTKNSEGILQTIKRSFTVYASGDQVTQSATPSATTTPVPSPSPSVNPSPSASASISPTPSASSAATASPSPTVAPLPPTGNNSTPLFAIVGVTLAIIGAVLFLVSRGAVRL